MEQATPLLNNPIQSSVSAPAQIDAVFLAQGSSRLARCNPIKLHKVNKYQFYLTIFH
jgi:hypothetical protein